MSTKETMMNQTHADYARMITAVSEALDAVFDAKKIIASMDPKSAGTIIISLQGGEKKKTSDVPRSHRFTSKMFLIVS